MSDQVERDFVGYGGHPLGPRWPRRRAAQVTFVLNYEEGSEPSMGDGDGDGVTERGAGAQSRRGRSDPRCRRAASRARGAHTT